CHRHPDGPSTQPAHPGSTGPHRPHSPATSSRDHIEPAEEPTKRRCRPSTLLALGTWCRSSPFRASSASGSPCPHPRHPAARPRAELVVEPPGQHSGSIASASKRPVQQLPHWLLAPETPQRRSLEPAPGSGSVQVVAGLPP